MTQDTTAYVKIYVNVVVEHRSDGKKTPREIRFDDGRRFEIDKVTDRRRAAATKVGGTGIRYTIFIHGQERKLFEDDGLWFVEGIAGRIVE
jgi:hypothetical protein